MATNATPPNSVSDTLKPVATVASVRGSVTAIGADGIERVLTIGDAVYAGDLIRTGANGEVAIQPNSAAAYTLGAQAQALLDDAGAQITDDDDTTVSAVSVEAIQRAILAGEDPTLIAPPPEAGPVSGGGHSGVRVDRTAGRATPDSGFETTGLSQAFPDSEDRTRFVDQDAGGTADGAPPGVPPPVSPSTTTSVTLTPQDPDPNALPGQWVVQEDSSTADSPNALTVAAGAGTGGSLSELVITGLDPAWAVDLSGLNVGGATATLNAAGDTLTISGLSGDSYSGVLRTAPPPDSDSDLGTLSATVSALDGGGSPATDSAALEVVADANADPVTVDIEVESDSGDSTFDAGESGIATVIATFGDFLDGSETHTVTVGIPSGFSASVPATLPPGVSVETSLPGLLVFSLPTDAVDGLGTFEVELAVINDSSTPLAATFTSEARAVETRTGDVEPDSSTRDNVAVANDPAPVLTVTLTPESPDPNAAPGQWVLQEDSSAADPPNALTVAASTGTGGMLSQLVVTGLDPAWAVDLSGLNVGGAIATLNAAGDTLTISGLSGDSYAGVLRVAPPPDSDVDLGTLTATVTALDTGGIPIADSAALEVVADANADLVTVDIEVSDSAGDSNDIFGIGETGSATVTATFGDALDGSETHTVTATVPAGFTVGAITGGGVFDAASGTITWTVPSDGSAAGGFSESFDVTNDSAPSGPANFTATARAEETSSGDVEPDSSLGDNVATATDSDTATVGTLPLAGNLTAEVTESALADGSGDDPEQPPLSVVASDMLTADFGSIAGISFEGGPGGGVTDDSTATDFVLNATDGSWTLSVNRTTNVYTFTLNDDVVHSDDSQAFGDDVRSVAFNYTVEGPGGTAAGSLIVDIRDDRPSASDISNEGDDLTPVNTNLLIVIDRSGSMDDAPGVGGFSTRLDLARSALERLLDSYDILGDLNVRIVDFADTASISAWFDGDGSVTDAVAYLDSLTAFGDTDYAEALQVARTAFDDSTPALEPGLTYQSLAYFLSDGKPTSGGEPGDNSIPDGEVTQWQAFLVDQGFNQAFAVGIGAGISAADVDLEDVAWPNDDLTNPIIVEDSSKLVTELLATVATPISGNVIGDVGVSFGADDQGFVQSITVDGTTYLFNRSSGEITVAGTVVAMMGVLVVDTALGGRLELNFENGDYTYSPPNVDSTRVETFAFTLADNDGDTSSASLSITINNVGLMAEARPDTIITNVVDGSAVGIPDWLLLDNDAPASTDPLTVSEIIAVPGMGAASLVGGDVVYTSPSTGPFSGEFNYRANDSEPTTVNVEGRAGATLSGGSSSDILLGGAASDTLRSGSGHDILVGGAGDDDLIGESGGENILAGGLGADDYIDGRGTENIIRLSAEDVGSGVDTAYGFDNSTDPDFGDKIDISDVLDSLEDAGLFSGDRNSASDLSQVINVSLDGDNVSINLDLTGSGSFNAGNEVLRLTSDNHPIHVSSNAIGIGGAVGFAGTSLEQMLTDGVLITS